MKLRLGLEGHVYRLISISFLLLAAVSPATATELKDILGGRWCQPDGSSYAFSRAQLIVKRADGTTRTLRISKTRKAENWLEIHWTGGGATGFRLSADMRVLVQLPNASGDAGPRREFRRC